MKQHAMTALQPLDQIFAIMETHVRKCAGSIQGAWKGCGSHTLGAHASSDGILQGKSGGIRPQAQVTVTIGIMAA